MNNSNINQAEQLRKNAVSKSALLKRYFTLENRLEILNKIKEYTYYNNSFKIRKLNKLIFVTKRKVKILENYLRHILKTEPKLRVNNSPSCGKDVRSIEIEQSIFNKF
jgi:hypothetical protein